MNNKLKILFCSKRGDTGGIAMWTEHILEYYNKNKISNIELKWLNSQSKGTEVFENTPLIKRLIIGVHKHLPFLKTLKTVLKESKYDLVHYTSSASLSLIKDIICINIIHKNNTKVIIHFHFGRIPDIFSKNCVERFLITKVINYADGVVVIDNKSYSTLVEYGFSNIYLLPNPLSEDIVEYIENNHLPRKEREILFVGHIVEGKGVFELIEACKQIPNIHITILGKGYSDVLNRLKDKAGARLMPNINFIGVKPQKTVIDNMLQCSLFVLPTYTEGFPNVIIESMACGCPIITTDVGAIPEMLDIENKNSCGICIKPKQISELKDAIVKMLDDKTFAYSCGYNAQKRVMDNYSMPIVWDQMCLIWNSVFNKK